MCPRKWAWARSWRLCRALTFGRTPKAWGQHTSSEVNFLQEVHFALKMRGRVCEKSDALNAASEMDEWVGVIKAAGQ